MTKTKLLPLHCLPLAIMLLLNLLGATAYQQGTIFPSYTERFQLLAQKFHAAAILTEEGPLYFALRKLVRDTQTVSPAVIRDVVLQSVQGFHTRGKQSADTVFLGQSVLEEQNTSSELCLNHAEATLVGLLAGDAWALQMVDAMGKPRPGLMDFNLNWPGAYKQCVNVRANTSVTSHPYFSGQYCTMSAVVPSNSAGDNPWGQMLGIQLGICVPDTCSENDLLLLLDSVFSLLNVTVLTPGGVTCAFRDTHLDVRAIVAILICVIFLSLVAVGTVLDVVLVQKLKWQQTEQFQKSIDATVTIENENQPLLLKHSDQHQPTVMDPELGVCCRLLMSFSMYTNCSKLLSTRNQQGTLTCIHGVRFLSMTWVVLGHCITTPIYASENTVPYFKDVAKRWTYQAIINATVSVDSFFVLSGLLVAYLSLKEMKKRRGKMNWILFYFHRFWRLTPVYMVSLMIYVCLMQYWGEGPFWPNTLPDRNNCEKNWWTNLLYINNLVHLNESCFGHSWYLANDMQFYILSPLIFVPLFFYPVVGVVISVIFLLATSITPAILTIQDHFPPGMVAMVQVNNTDMQDYMADFYVKPYNRMGPYVVGMLAGYFLYRTDCRLKIGKVTNLCLWAAAAGSALAVLYGLYDATLTNSHPVTLSVSAFYNAVNRQVWGACVAWVIIACVTGNGGFVNTLLSWSGLVPLSRLTYCIYLLHVMILETFVLNLQDVFYLSDINLVALFIAILVVSYMAAFFVSLVFEAPMMMLEKVLLPKKTGQSEQKSKTIQ